MMEKARWFTSALALLALILAVPAAVYGGAPVGSRFLIQNSSGVDEVEAAVAYNSQAHEYLVVWTAEATGPVKEIWGRRVSSDGTLLGAAFRISPANDGYHPDVAYNSTTNEYLVVWETGQSIRGQIVTGTGLLVGSDFTIAAGYVHGSYHYTEPAVAYGSTSDRYVVAFRYIWDLDGTSQIQARAYLNNGSPEDNAFEVSPSSYNSKFPDQPDLAYNRSRNEFLVAWRQEYSSTDHDIYGRRVKLTGGAGVQGNTLLIATSGDDEGTPTVAAIPTVPDAGQYLVAWESDGDIKARTVAWDGTLGARRDLATTSWTEQGPAAAGCESNQQFLVAWVWIPVVTPPAMMQVQARTLALDGALLDSTTTVGGGQVFETAIAAGPTGDFLMAFDDNEVIGVANRGIYGHFWGNRVYLPLVIRNH